MCTNAYVYVYDPIGNRLFAAVNAGTNGYTANCLNQYTGISGVQSAAPTYDLDGNMLTFGEWAYSWDGENRMIGASWDQGSGIQGSGRKRFLNPEP
jgi:hypothetical protein